MGTNADDVVLVELTCMELTCVEGVYPTCQYHNEYMAAIAMFEWEIKRGDRRWYEARSAELEERLCMK